MTPLFMVPAEAASKPSVSVKQSATSAFPGSFVSFSGKVSKKSAKARIQLERKQGSTWYRVASSKVSKSRKYTLKTRLNTGTYWYRVKVIGNSKIKTATSRSVKAHGLYLASTKPAFIGEPFTLSAQLGTYISRPGEIQKRVDGVWQPIASYTSAPNGVARASITLQEQSVLRFFAPATTLNGRSYGAWVTPETTISVTDGQTPEVMSILGDINNYREANGEPPLILSLPMSRVAHNWSKYMHDSQKFYHNPNYGDQIPEGWYLAGENIAAGQGVEGVVGAWIKSPGHRDNILGPFTHIGIGYYEGTKGYGTYFTTVFASYE